MLRVIFLLHLAYNLGSAHATPEEFENRGFTLTTHETFSVHTKPEKFKNVTNPCTITYIIIWQGSLGINHSVLIGSFLVGILPYGPFPWKRETAIRSVFFVLKKPEISKQV